MGADLDSVGYLPDWKGENDDMEERRVLKATQ